MKYTVAYLEPCQTSKMELFEKIVNGFKGSILDAWQGSEYVYDTSYSLPSIFFNPLTTSVPHHIETSQLICIANQVTGSYMMRNISR